MWLAELSERSGVPIPTIKYYRREGLLHAGEAAGATRSKYDETHVDRLRLIRALVAVAGMPLARVREVLTVVDDDATSASRAIGAAHARLSAPPAAEPSPHSRGRVDALARTRRWRVERDGPRAAALAAALDAMAAAGLPMGDETLATYADAALAVARSDVSGMRQLNRERAVERAVTGTLLGEQVLLALRRLAHEATARRRARG